MKSCTILIGIIFTEMLGASNSGLERLGGILDSLAVTPTTEPLTLPPMSAVAASSSALQNNTRSQCHMAFREEISFGDLYHALDTFSAQLRVREQERLRQLAQLRAEFRAEEFADQRRLDEFLARAEQYEGTLAYSLLIPMLKEIKTEHPYLTMHVVRRVPSLRLAGSQSSSTVSLSSSIPQQATNSSFGSSLAHASDLKGMRYLPVSRENNTSDLLLSYDSNLRNVQAAAALSSTSQFLGSGLNSPRSSKRVSFRDLEQQQLHQHGSFGSEVAQFQNRQQRQQRRSDSRGLLMLGSNYAGATILDSDSDDSPVIVEGPSSRLLQAQPRREECSAFVKERNRSVLSRMEQQREDERTIMQQQARVLTASVQQLSQALHEVDPACLGKK